MDKEIIGKELAKFDLAESAVAEMRGKYLTLKVTSTTDTEGYKACREARIVVKNKRCDIEKRRKELKEESLKWGRTVDTEAKRLTALLEPIETYLESQEKIVDDEKKRVELEAARKLQEMIEHRLTLLAQYRKAARPEVLSAMPEEVFQNELAMAKWEYDLKIEEAKKLEEARKAEAGRLAAVQRAEAERLAKVAAEQAAENARLAEERRKIAIQQEEERRRQQEISDIQARKEAELHAERQKIAAEKEALEAAKKREEFEKNHQIELEKAKKEAEKRAVAEAEAKKKAEEEAKAKAESLRPDKEKIDKYFSSLVEIPVPIITSQELRLILEDFHKGMSTLVAEYRVAVCD